MELLARATHDPICCCPILGSRLHLLPFAFSILYLLRHNHVRASPYALVLRGCDRGGCTFLVWRGMAWGPRFIVLLQPGTKDIPPLTARVVLCVACVRSPAFFAAYSLFVALIYLLTRSRRRIERSLREARDQLEAEVQARTAEYARINAEYKTILQTPAPFGLPSWRPIALLRRCNPAITRG